jgi:hypothetical protein
MPFTLFAHQAFVLPLKWARPRWFDGTALCLGSMAPDWAYALEGTRWYLRSHTIAALFWWSLPLTLAATWLVRHVVAAPLGHALPGKWGSAVAALATARRSVPRTMVSALVGAGSHQFVDGFTHANGWATRRSELLSRWVHLGGLDVQVTRIIQYAGHVIGSLAGVLMLVAIVRTGRLEAWSAEPPSAPSSAASDPPTGGEGWGEGVAPRRMRAAIAAGVALAVLAAWTVSFLGGGVPAAVMRASWSFSLAVLVGAVLARSASSSS